MKTKFFTKPIMAVLVALVMLCSCFNIFKLDNSISAEASPAHDTLYYFSDSTDASTYVQYVNTIGHVGTANLIFYPDMEMYITNNLSSTYQSISNAYIIFEISNGFTLTAEFESPNPTVTSALKTIFQWWKLHNCDIMCILNTDEFIFSYDGYDDFLAYADIHVNTDVFTQFCSNLFVNVAEDCENDGLIENCTFILNESIARDANTNFFGSWFLYKYFCPVFNYMYMSDTNVQNGSVAELFNSKGIEVFYRMSTGDYLDIVHNNLITLEDFSDPDVHAENNKVYGVGYQNSNAPYNMTDYDWLDDMYQLREDLDYNFDIYVYDETNYASSIYTEENVYVVGRKTAIIDDIKDDFILGNDLTVYNNYNGRCIVSHKLYQDYSGLLGSPWFVIIRPGNGNLYLPWCRGAAMPYDIKQLVYHFSTLPCSA